MTHPLQNSNSSGGGNILFIKIKIECPAGQDLEIMTFRYLKTLVFDKLFQKLQIIWCFYFWGVSLVITNCLFNNLYNYLTLSPHIHLYPIHFRKFDMTPKNSGGSLRFPLLFKGRGGGGRGDVLTYCPIKLSEYLCNNNRNIWFS